MIRSIVLALLLIFVASQSVQPDFIGSLTVRDNTKNSKIKDRKITVIAPIFSPQLSNIKHLLIRVVVANPSSGCSQIKKYQSGDIIENLPIYYLIDGEGSCSYARKVQNAKQALGKGVIIVDSSSGNNNLNYKNTDKDKFITLFINPNDAKEILQVNTFLAELNMGNDQQKNKEDTIDQGLAQIWVSSLSKDSYVTQDWWRDASKAISNFQKRVKWMPRFAYISCNGQNDCQSQIGSSCACGGSFCSPQAHGKSSNVLVRQDIRQSIIFKDNPTKYLDYTKLFQQQCLQKYIKDKYAQDCSASVMHTLELPSTAINNQIDHFLGSCDVEDEQIMDQFQSMIQDRVKYHQIGHYPTIILNHQQLQFKNKDQLRSLLCRKLGLQKQNGCISIVQKSTIIQTIVTWFFYFILIMTLLGLGGLVVIFFRNRLRRQMNKQLKMQVSTAVEHYFSLSETK